MALLFKDFDVRNSRPLNPQVTITGVARTLPAFKPISSGMLKGSPELRAVQGRETLTHLKSHTGCVDASTLRVCERVCERVCVCMRQTFSVGVK